MQRGSLFWITCLLLRHDLLMSAEASAPAAYTLSQSHVKRDYVILRLIDRHTERQAWKRIVAGVSCLGWARDRKALALAVWVVNDHYFQILVWRGGKPVRLIAGRGHRGGWGAGGYENDGVLDFAWSPDDSRVLFRAWGSGGKDLNDGTLYCLDTKGWRLSCVTEGVRQMQWLGTRRVRYRVMKAWSHGNTFGEVVDPRPHFWNVP